MQQQERAGGKTEHQEAIVRDWRCERASLKEKKDDDQHAQSI